MIIVCNKWVRAGASTAIIVAAFASLLFSLVLIFFVFPRTEQVGTRLQTQIGLVKKEIDSKGQAAQVIGNVSQDAPSGKIIFSGSPVLPLESTPATGNQVYLLPVFISEVLVYGTNATDEFVELFNPNTVSVDMTGWQLKKKTESGVEYTLVTSKKFSGIIPAQGYFLISHPDVQKKYESDLVWSSASYSIAEKNTIILYDSNGTIVHSVDVSGLPQTKSASLASIQTSEFIVSDPNPYNSKSETGFRLPAVAQSPLISTAPSPQIVISPSVPVSVVQPSPAAMVMVPPVFTPVPTSSPEPTVEPSPSPSPTPIIVYPSITSVQFGIEGNAGADFIELYNSSDTVLNLTEYKLVKKTSGSGNEYTIKSWRNDQQIIPVQAHFYWVNSSYTEKTSELISQGKIVSTTTATISETNGVALKYGDTVVSGIQW